MTLENLGDFLEKVFAFIAAHGIAGAFAILWVSAEFRWWMERDERKSAQAELKQVSRDTTESMNDTASAIDKMAEAQRSTNGIFDRVLNVKPTNGRGRR
jgi:hypothetical protein